MKQIFQFTKFHITILLSAAVVVILLGMYWYSTTRHLVAVDITPVTKTIQVGGQITFATGAPAAGIYIAFNGTGIITADDGHFLTMLEIPVDQNQMSVHFYDKTDKIYQSTNYDNMVFVIDDSVQQDFVIESAP